jgi:hypothetical protein
MARGESGRIVIEVDPTLKGELYVELARRGLTLKAWFTGEVVRLLAEVDHSAPPTAERAARSDGTDSEDSKEIR